MTVTIECCDIRQRVTVTVTEIADGGTPITDQIEMAVENWPELKDWDWIFDLRLQVPPPPWDIPRLIALMDSREAHSNTVIVTGDPSAEAWVRILNSQFRARRHWVASTPAAAASLLDGKTRRYCRLQG